MNRFVTLMTLFMYGALAFAQSHPVIADMDTRLPLSGVAVSTDNGQRSLTDYKGRFSTTLPFSSATLSKKYYMQRRVGESELRQDTIFLIPQEVMLGEVVVKAPGSTMFDMNGSLRDIKENAKLDRRAGGGLNLLGIFQSLFPSRGARARSRAEKIKKILDKY